jgi:hypothetical protein
VAAYNLIPLDLIPKLDEDLAQSDNGGTEVGISNSFDGKDM